MAAIESESSSVTVRSGSDIDEKNAKAIELIEDMTKNVESIQKKVLAEILSENGNTEYLQRFNLPKGATDHRVYFKSNVPVITYEDIKPDIHRVANGDKSPIFSSQPITEFLISSGTSGGERKMFPTTDEDMHRRLKFRSLFMPVINRYVPGLDKGKGLYFILTKADSWTPGGILARPPTTAFNKNLIFYRHSKQQHDLVFTSPIETVFCSDSFQSLYSQLLCGILMREQVLRIGATFASTLLHVITFLQHNWKQLAYDIKSATLSTKLVTDPSVRECISKILCNPNPELAEIITRECESENWERIIPRIWPHTKYIDVIVTGTMAQYISTLDYYSGGLPLVSTSYASSECSLGLNLNPLCQPSQVSYTIIPNMGYFEFIPTYADGNDSSEEPLPSHLDLVDLANLQIGKEYELVVTTYVGLYRYRMGDILQVTGFHNAAPQFKFVRRKNLVLSIDVEKTTEVELQKGIENASAMLRQYNVDVVDYTSCTDIKTIPGHYVIFLELLVKDPTNKTSQGVMNDCCLAIEESLNDLYRQRRAKLNAAIGPLEIRIVKQGTFEELMNDAVHRGTSIMQYKMPRCVNFTPTLQLLDSRVLSVHFSPTVPRLI